MGHGGRLGRRWIVAGVCAFAVLNAASAHAATSATDRWLPNPTSATWTYGWNDSEFSKPVTFERYTVEKRTSATVTLDWTTDDAGNADGITASNGSIEYRYADSGLVNTNWSSTAPPAQFPVLCNVATQCGNSLSGAHYLLIWGTRSPLLQEPLTVGATWNSFGGQNNDVASRNRYLGIERVVVPGFPRGVFAAKIQSDITQAGAIGDPYGSGLRTVWWVYGVGPVKIVFAHAGGQVSTAELYATNLVPKVRPSDRAWLPLIQGQTMRYRYTNNRHLKTPSRQQFSVGAVVSNTARVDVRELSGPIKVRGNYVFSSGLGGVTNLSVQTSAATTAHFPALGPRSAPVSQRRHFFTPLDLMTYGFNPVVTAFPKPKQSWRSAKGGRDRAVYGVTGTSRVIGFQTVKVPAGRFRALLVESKLNQPGFSYGSGVRDSWFASGVGLVKLVFRHNDGSTSTVERLK